MARKYTQVGEIELRLYSTNRTPMAVIVRETGRTAEALRRKAAKLGLSLGHQVASRKDRIVNELPLTAPKN